MRRTLTVHLGEDERPAGGLRYDRQGARESAAFAYDEGFTDAFGHVERSAIQKFL